MINIPNEDKENLQPAKKPKELFFKVETVYKTPQKRGRPAKIKSIKNSSNKNLRKDSKEKSTKEEDQISENYQDNEDIIKNVFINCILNENEDYELFIIKLNSIANISNHINTVFDNLRVLSDPQDIQCNMENILVLLGSLKHKIKNLFSLKDTKNKFNKIDANKYKDIFILKDYLTKLKNSITSNKEEFDCSLNETLCFLDWLCGEIGNPFQ